MAFCKSNGDSCFDILASRRMTRPDRPTGWPDTDRGQYVIFELVRSLYVLLQAVRAKFEARGFLPSRNAVPPSSRDFLELHFTDERDRFQLDIAVRAREITVSLAALEDVVVVRNKPSGWITHHHAKVRFDTDAHMPNNVEFSKSNMSQVTVPRDTSHNRFTAKLFYKVLRSLALGRPAARFQVSIVIDGSLSGAAKRSFQTFSLYDNDFTFKIEPRSFPDASGKAYYSLTRGLNLVMV